MVNRRYQVFISSTYSDLRHERDKVMQAVMEMDCFPAGMEWWPAADEEQFEFIKRIIDDSDYYVIIVGGRYGSKHPCGLSFTEMEYDYAREKGLKIIALVHDKPDLLSVSRTDAEPEARAQLIEFRKKLGEGRLIKPWKEANELPGLVMAALAWVTKVYPAKGWTRGGREDSEELLRQINDLRTENETLRQNVNVVTSSVGFDPARLKCGADEEIFELIVKEDNQDFKLPLRKSWDFWFNILGPGIIAETSEGEAYRGFNHRLSENLDIPSVRMTIDDFTTIIFQFRSLGLISIVSPPPGAGYVAYGITPRGMDHLAALRTVLREEVGPEESVPTHSASV